MIKDDFIGPLDEAAWPKKLTARVLEPGEVARVHGYALESDLAANYTFPEIVLLALTGELPAPKKARAFEVACAFFARTSAAEAPVHAALLARICNATTSAIAGVGAIALGEQARSDLARYDAFLAWLADPQGPLPSDFLARDRIESTRTISLKAALIRRDAFVPIALELDLEPDAATIAVFHACGLDTLPELEAVRLHCRFPMLIAEALAAPPAKYKEYPVTLPQIRYEEDVS